MSNNMNNKFENKAGKEYIIMKDDIDKLIDSKFNKFDNMFNSIDTKMDNNLIWFDNITKEGINSKFNEIK